MTNHARIQSMSGWRSCLPILVGAVAASACGGGDQVVRQAPEVTVAQPVVRPIQPYVDFTGTTQAVEAAEIRARVGGVLERQLFSASDIVNQGDVLFVIEQEQYRAARDEAVASVRSSVADSALKESNLERVRIAIETNAVSRQDLDRAQAERDAAVAAVLGARARLTKAQLDYDYTSVRSPITGQVGRRRVDPGNLVGFGEQTLLTTVNRMQPMHVFFNAPEWVVLAMVRAMDEARQVVDDEAMMETVGREEELSESEIQAQKRVATVLVGTAADADTFPFQGYIDFIGNTVDPSTGTIELRGVFENEDLLLFPGLFVRVRVLAMETRDALLVDERAIGTDLGGKYMYLVGEDNMVERVYVTVGQPQPDGTIVVESGIEVGDTYISNGLLRARPGLPVTPLTEEELAQRQAAMQGQAGAAADEEPEAEE
ncbi:MAG: efflux RND transporter periplasmic adaptor subunit [marine benthic group bacterium]|jgi:RND family efflux transporter MFP subunit|nr:efflux RND transporter periplasmic adaptor subunit [Candidatus Benthicola marisminoris]